MAFILKLGHLLVKMSKFAFKAFFLYKENNAY